ncbi:MAG: alpha/beta hydrolase-fold protein [Pseudomonadota bacterium]
MAKPENHGALGAIYIALIIGLLAGCGGSSSDNNIMESLTGSPLLGCADTDSCSSNPILTIDEDRPAQAYIPADYNIATTYPLIIVLHGRGATGPIQALYFDLLDRVDAQQFVLIAPDGTLDIEDRRSWNATPACCAFTPETQAVDDVAYIRGLIEKAAATYSIDPARIGLIGHSNGGFLSLRMACEVSELVTSVVSLAGSTFEDASSCAPATNPVNVLTLHGTQDDTIAYEGGEIFAEIEGIGGVYPGALETIDRYAALAQCTASNTEEGKLDVISSVPGSETDVLSYTGCVDGVDIELWTLQGGSHVPFPWQADALDSMVRWLTDHARETWQ